VNRDVVFHTIAALRVGDITVHENVPQMAIPSEYLSAALTVSPDSSCRTFRVQRATI
jgi:hypothetical protein